MVFFGWINAIIKHLLLKLCEGFWTADLKPKYFEEISEKILGAFPQISVFSFLQFSFSSFSILLLNPPPKKKSFHRDFPESSNHTMLTFHLFLSHSLFTNPEMGMHWWWHPRILLLQSIVYFFKCYDTQSTVATAFGLSQKPSCSLPKHLLFSFFLFFF